MDFFLHVLLSEHFWIFLLGVGVGWWAAVTWGWNAHVETIRRRELDRINAVAEADRRRWWR